MTPWFETPFCRPGGRHCERCRDTGERGERWREDKRQHFEVPRLWWQCPYGLPWDWRPAEAKGLGDMVEDVLNVTRIGPAYKRLHKRVTGRPCGCKKRKRWLNDVWFRALDRVRGKGSENGPAVHQPSDPEVRG
jgi:hypothetical protein